MTKRTIRALAFPAAPHLEPLVSHPGAPLLAPPPAPRSPPRGTLLVAMRREDKEVLDALQAWWHFRTGTRLPTERLFSLVLQAALANPAAPFHAARFVSPRRNT